MAIMRRITEINGEIIMVEIMIIVDNIILCTIHINGGPTWNDIAFGIVLKEVVESCELIAKTVHPVVSTMLPRELHTNLVWNQE